jgi:uncharacterized protein
MLARLSIPLSAALAGAIALLPAAARAQPSMAERMPSQIHVSGMGEARATPDRATVQVGVQTRAATASAASAENARKQTAIVQAIKALGIAAEDIATAQFNVHPEMQHDERGVGRVTGYVVSNVVRVELKRLDLVGRVIDASLTNGANQINSLDFWASNTDQPRREALEQAVSRARAEAEVIARAAGGTLGRLLEISSSGFVMPMPRREMMAMEMRGVVAGAPTPVEPGQETIRASVTARWEFLPGSR